jgi:transcriptional regulator with XRE-family HTH domain
MNTIGEKIAELRKAKNMTQEELSSVIGVSAQSVSKWENNATMPDIMLLPVISDIFEVSLDTLFGKSKEKTQTFPLDEITDKAYDGLLECMMLAWQHNQRSDTFSNSFIQDFKNHISEYPQSQTSIFSETNGAVYANNQLGLIYKKPQNGCAVLLKDIGARDMLAALSDDAFMAILQYHITDEGLSYTVSSMAKKCGFSIEDTQKALDRLQKYSFVDVRNVKMDEEQVKVYGMSGSHKMLLVYAILSLAGRLADYHEHYYGFSGITKGWMGK